MPTSAVLSARTVVGSIAVAAIALLAGVLLSGWEPAQAQEEAPAVAISVGDEHACALLDSGAVECWGYNEDGQTDAPGGRFSAVSAGEDHTCALRETGAVKCWGSYGGAADVPAWLRPASLPSTGTGGLLNRRISSLEPGAIALAALGIPTLSLLTLSAWRRSRP